MQIDILSSNTLKLTLSRLDMFDLDIKYESLSGKNPETKRLLAHVLKSIRLDQMSHKVGFDFTCERIFVEAFPRPDGGCMLYVSSLEADGAGKKRKAQLKPKETENPEEPQSEETVYKAQSLKRENLKSLLIFETDGVNALGGVCKSLCLQKEWERTNFESALYLRENKYRLVIKGENRLITRIVREYGEVLKGERELMHTKENFRTIIEESAAERLTELL